jgi:hypothetical protein
LTIVTAKFEHKPTYVDAVQVTAENFQEMAKWCEGTIEDESGTQYIRVRVPNPMRPRQTKAFVNDWILYSELYGYKVYTDSSFRRAFDPMKTPQLEEVIGKE